MMRRLFGRRASSRSAGPVGHEVLRSLRSSTTTDFESCEVPEAAVEIDREALNCVLTRLRVAKNSVGRLFAAEEHDGGAVGASPLRRDGAPIHVVAPIHLSGIDDVRRALFALELDKLVVRAVGVELDLDHRGLAVLVRDDDDPVRVPWQRRNLRANAEVVVNAADALRPFSECGEET